MCHCNAPSANDAPCCRVEPDQMTEFTAVISIGIPQPFSRTVRASEVVFLSTHRKCTNGPQAKKRKAVFVPEKGNKTEMTGIVLEAENMDFHTLNSYLILIIFSNVL